MKAGKMAASMDVERVVTMAVWMVLTSVDAKVDWMAQMSVDVMVALLVDAKGDRMAGMSADQMVEWMVDLRVGLLADETVLKSVEQMDVSSVDGLVGRWDVYLVGRRAVW